MTKNNKIPQRSPQVNRPTAKKMDTSSKEVDMNYLKSFYPTPVKGMKWVYAMTISIQGMNIQGEMIMEVTEVLGEDVKLSIAIGAQRHEESLNINSFAPVPNASGKKDSTGYTYEGQESLNLPYKALDTTKLSTPNNDGKGYLWLAHGIGPVKFGISQAGVPATLELKSFS
ncbi:hypothetical protein EON78_01300 [bacterium]|nr:MAG: hypothetical protein EON78_01300 [bacterium]